METKNQDKLQKNIFGAIVMSLIFFVAIIVCAQTPLETAVNDANKIPSVYETENPLKGHTKKAIDYDYNKQVKIGDNLLANAVVSTSVFPEDAHKLTDGIKSTSWRSNYLFSVGATVSIEFDKPTVVNKVLFLDAANLTAYKLMVSANGENYKEITFSGTNNRHDISQVFEPVSAKRMKLYLYGVPQNAAIHISEISVENVGNEEITRVIPPEVIDENLGKNNLLKTAASVNVNVLYSDAYKLYDDDLNDPWRTNYAINVIGQVDVDFGKIKSFNKFAVLGLRNANFYTFEYSEDGASYVTIPQTEETGINNIELFDEAQARFIRLTVRGGSENLAVFIGQFIVERVRNLDNEIIAINRFKDPVKARMDDLYKALGNDAVFVLGSTKALIHGQSVNLGAAAPVALEERAYVQPEFIAKWFGVAPPNGDAPVPLDQFCRITGKQMYWEKRGLIFIGDHVVDKYKFAENDAYMAEIANLIVLERPTPGKIAEDVRRSNPNDVHPRLFKTELQINNLLRASASDRVYGVVSNSIITSAESILEKPIPIDMRTYRKISQLVAAHTITKDGKYKAKIWDFLEANAKISSWGASSLELAYTAKSYALAYDWLYDEWTPAQRRVISDAIRSECLQPMLKAYNGSHSTLTNNIIGTNNINTIGNASVVMAALAIFESDPELCAEIISNALRAAERALVNWQPEGAWMEGVGYGRETLESAAHLITALESAAGTDYGISEMPGLSQAGYFVLYSTGPTGAFNFNDAREETAFNAPPVMLWLANRYGEKALGDTRVKNIVSTNTGSFEDWIWYAPMTFDERPEFPLDRIFAGTYSGAFLSAWNDPDAMYLGFKGGVNGEPHGDLNAGTFVLDAAGERWVMLLGQDDYSLPGTFSRGYGAQRWNYYRYRAEGNNTLIVNPTSAEDMFSTASAPIESFYSSEDTAFSIVNMTAVHDGVLNARRGFMLTRCRTAAVIQDEVALRENGDIWWFAHTRALITIAKDGRSALLRLNGKQMDVYLNGGDGLMFTAMDAAPLPTSPNPQGQNQNDGVRKLAIHGTGKTKYKFSVTFALPQDGSGESFSFKSLDEW